VSADEVERLKRSGADDFIKKPFDVNQLTVNIADLLGV
jgi:DNA-binding response OmpR family regulator